MIYPSKKEFIRLSKKGNLIPVCLEILADFDTPVSAYLKLNKSSHSFLLESVEGEEKVARYSFLGSNPSLIFESKGSRVTITRKKGARKSIARFIAKEDPLEEIKKLMKQYRFVQIKNLPRFSGGLVGFIGYDMVRFFEPKLQITAKRLKDDLAFPDIHMVLADNLIIFDHREHTMKIVQCVHTGGGKTSTGTKKLASLYDSAVRTLKTRARDLEKPVGSKSSTFTLPSFTFKANSNLSKKRFQAIVKKAKHYIRAGDIIQTVLSQRFSVKLNTHSFNVYRALRQINPSAYMYYLQFGTRCLVGSSPELLIRCEDGIVQTRPIAGTRPRGKNEREDEALSKNLINDAKERAEHIMLVDLGRNDLGRVCKKGTVRLSEFMKIEKFSHVMHIVSNVVGSLSKGKDNYDVLRATFPAGTVTGAPKIRAMEIIDELENVKRGPYAGCIGYFSFSGNLDTCITIRTIVIKGNMAYMQAGAGIVADSLPQREYRETVNKAKAQLLAIQLAEKSFR
ncbi:anthranilate synthase component I [Candidatus Omnitrophota bacterium]